VNGRVPRYHRIAESLRERIRGGEWMAGAPLPNQRRLARDFGVTLMTLRQALELLERDNLITRRHGLGTFVAAPSIDYEINKLLRLAGDLSAQGESVSTRVLAARPAVADRRVSAALGVTPRARVVMVERLRLVDDHPTVLASLATAVDGADDMTLIGTAATIGQAMVLATTSDVLVSDIQLDGHAEGLELLKRLHDPRTPREAPRPAILLLSGFGQPSLVRAAIDRGAAGYLHKSAGLPEILAAIRTVAAGGTVFSAAALQSSRTARRRPSDRELQVVDLVIGGATNAEVATALGLSEKTVESHLRRLFDRYGLLSRTELAVLALDEGWSVRSAAGDAGPTVADTPREQGRR
jgi:DNA-binding NarL/FixJ family response regulator